MNNKQTFNLLGELVDLTDQKDIIAKTREVLLELFTLPINLLSSDEKENLANLLEKNLDNFNLFVLEMVKLSDIQSRDILLKIRSGFQFLMTDLREVKTTNGNKLNFGLLRENLFSFDKILNHWRYNSNTNHWCENDSTTYKWKDIIRPNFVPADHWWWED